ncbi:unnamed protein product [Brachionus calyciflorus]|uniref:KASH domain-containing protein n=1 Tax=Brachionus calyciflorus TaxID=104777 RepID=A0A813M8G6_9BILA|nr:unnamed protein product [Brachionus calyciflorus]
MVKERLFKIESLLNKTVKLFSLGKYQDEMQKSSNDLDCLETNLKLISKLSQRIDLKNEKDKLNTFLNEIRSSEQKMFQMKNCVIDLSKKIVKMLPIVNSIENGLQEIEYWIVEGENLVRLEPDQYNFDEILRHIEKQKKHFDELKKHSNSIKNKIQQLQSIRQLVTQNIDANELNNKLCKIKDQMNNLNTKRLKWEELFHAQQSLWRSFHSKTKQLEEWITNAQQIVNEKNDDYNFLIHKHKDFFDNINSEILNGFLGAGEKLFCLKNERDKLEIKTLMETLEGQWKMILSHGPIRLLKLEFKRIELLLKHELIEADRELNQCFNSLAENRDSKKIFKKFQEKFKNSNFYSLCESYLENMKNCVLQLAEKKIEDRSFIEDAFQNLNTQWINLTQKIEAFNNNLQSKLNIRETVDRNITILDSWLYELETTSKEIFDYNLPSASEYSRALNKIKNLLQDLNPNKRLLNDVHGQIELLNKIEKVSLNETTINFMENLKDRFEKLFNEDLEQIEIRSDYLHGILLISQKLDIISNKIRNLSCSSTRRFMAEEDDSSLHTAVEEQKSVLDQMRIYEQEVDQLKLEAKKLANNDQLQMPTVIYEKLNCVQETIRHNISEELERRSSLLEIQQINGQKQNKLDLINQNIESLENIMTLKHSDKSKQDSFTSFFDSNLLNDTLDEVNEETKFESFFKKLTKCKDLISNCRYLMDDLNQPSASTSLCSIQSSLPEQTFINLYNKLNNYEKQIDNLLFYYEENLARKVKTENQLEALKNNLADILKRFEVYGQLDLEIKKEDDIKKSINLLEIEHSKLNNDLEKIEKLKNELAIFINELNHQKELVSLEPFTEHFLFDFIDLIKQDDILRENELNSRINDFANDLNLVEDNYRNKLSEILFKLNQHTICKKQIKLDHLTNTLDLQLDTLICITKEKEDLMDVLDDDFDDLRKESENILLERMSLDETQSTPNQSKKDLLILQETTTRQVVRTIENVVKDDHRYEVYKILPINGEDEDHYGEITVDYLLESDEKMHNQFEESIIIENESEQLKIERGLLEKERTELERSILERDKYEQQFIERENLLKIERERLELEKTQLEMSRIEIENKERFERAKLEYEKIELEKQERQKREAIENMIKKERENLEKEKALLEKSKYEKMENERLECEKMERLIRLEREKIENEKKELERQRIEKEREKAELERIEFERKEMERKKLESQRIENEKRKIEMERLERERIELEKLTKIERERMERERIERENLELERQEIERRRLEAEKLERERIELERIASLERERLERERLELEREKIEIERRRLEKEKLERERLELEEIYRLEEERLEREKLELEKQRREKEMLEKEKLELERQRMEKEKLEKERHELEKQKRIEKEKIDKERIYLENLEKERLELERQELERIKLIEKERAERLRQERLKIEKIRAEREEKERIDRERREKERAEAEKILELKRKEREDDELEMQRERERQVEIERVENELRRDKLEKLEQERLRNQEKFKLELHLKEICEKLNNLKLKILDIQTNEINSFDLIQDYELEINDLDDQLLSLYNKSISLENRLINPNNTVYYLFDSLDQATLTQFELLRSFLAYLNTQIAHKKKDILHRADLKIKLNNLKENLDRYIHLAMKFNSPKNENEPYIYVEDQQDLQQRIISIESIENSIETCFKQINEISKELKNEEFIENFIRDKSEIDANIVQPLLMNLSMLKHCLSQWTFFDDKFKSLKNFLYERVNFGELIDLMRQESILNLNSETCPTSLEFELEKYSNLRCILNKKLTESEELLMLGTNLFDLNQKPCVVCPTASREFIEMRQLINEVCKFLDEKCSMLRFGLKERKKLEMVQQNLNKVKFDLDEILIEEEKMMMVVVENTQDIILYKQKYEKLNEMKKKVRFLIDEIEKDDDSTNLMNDADETSEIFRNQDSRKKLNLGFKLDLDNTIKSLVEKLTDLEMEYHQKIMKNLPSRNSLNDLQKWLFNANERLENQELIIETDRPIDLKKLEIFKKDLTQLKDELTNEKEVELKFCTDIIDNEIKQGFYDLSIQQKSSQIKNEFDRFRLKLNSNLDRIEISILKLKEFDRSIHQIKYWINNKNKQNELENFTKFKTCFDESTILMDEMTNLTCLDDEKNLIKQILSLLKELEEIKNFWLNDKIVNDPTIRTIIYDYINNELNNLKNDLEKIELFNQIKIENNLSQLKQTYTSEINELNLGLQNELNFILNGKMTTLIQYVTSVQNLKKILEKLDLKRTEMARNLKKFELDLKTTDLPVIINLSNRNTGFLMDPHIKHSILNNLTNRDLELKAKNLIYQAEKDLIEHWKKYDNLYKTLLERLESTHESLTKDLDNIETTINTENLLLKSNLFEQTVNDMIRNKSLFADLEHFGENLWNLNENIKSEFSKNKVFIEEKFEKLSELADKLSHKLERVGQEHKNYIQVIESVDDILIKCNNIIRDYSQSDNRLSSDIKKMCDEIECTESDLRSKITQFKSLNVKDTERIEKTYELTSKCSFTINKLRDLRIKLLDQIQERNYLIEIKLNDLESFLNTLDNFINEKFSTHLENTFILDKYINCIKYLQANNLDLNKWELSLDHLEIEVNEDIHKEKIGLFKEKVLKFRRIIRILNFKDGLFEQLIRLKDLSQIINSLDFKLINDEIKLIHLKEDFIDLKFKIEKLINDSGLINFDFFKANCLKSIEAKLNECITSFMELNDLGKKFKILFAKIDSKIIEIDKKFGTELSEFTQDLSSYEQKLMNIKELKTILASNDLRLDLEELQVMSDRLEMSNEYQQIRIKYLDLCCDLDKSINKLDFEYDHLKQMIDKSQKLLDLIKESHEELSKFKKENLLEQSIDQMLDQMKLSIQGRLAENEPIKSEIIDLYTKYLTKTSDKSIDLIKDIIDKLLFEWNLINEKCVLKIKKFELFKSKLVDMDEKLNKIREYTQSMENYILYEMFCNFDLTDKTQIMVKKQELENLLDCLSKKDPNTDLVLKQAFNMYKSNKEQTNYINILKTRWTDLKFLIRDKLLKLSNIWLFLNDQIENFYVILSKTEDFYTNILLNANNLVIDENEIDKNCELSKYTSFFRLIEDLYSTINEDNKLIKYLNESFVNFSKYVHDFESAECLEKIKDKLMDINSRWDTLHNDIAIKIKLARKYQTNIREIVNLPFNDNLHFWINEMNLLIINLEHLSAKELLIKSREIQDIKREICNKTQFIFDNENKIKIESSFIDRIKDVMKRIIRLDTFLQQSTYLPKLYSPIPSQTTSIYENNNIIFSHF